MPAQRRRKPVPKPPAKPAARAVLLRLDENMLGSLELLANRWGMSREGTIRALLAESLSNDGMLAVPKIRPQSRRLGEYQDPRRWRGARRARARRKRPAGKK